MSIGLLIGICCAVLFFRAATYERMSPVLWVVASAGLTAIFSLVAPSIFFLLLGQVALFLVMWWYNARRPPRPD